MQHGELLEKLAKALTLIGDVLPEVELSADLYKIDKMEKALGMMYFNIILLFWRAFRWYNKSPASRFFGSFASPYELKYKDVMEKIKECSTNIELIASGASRAELRSVNVQVHLVKRDQQHLQRSMDEMRSQMEVVLKYVQGTHSVTQQAQTCVEDIHPRIYDLQYSQIIAHLTPSVDPVEMLRKGQSLVWRRQQKYGPPTRPASPVLNDLNTWALSSGCSLIILQAEPRANIITKDLAVSVIDHLQHAGCKPFWTLSYSGNTAAQPSAMSILKSLIFQAARDDPKVLTGMPDHLNIAKFTSAHSEQEMVDLLSVIISKMGQCFIVVESEELCRLLSEDLEASRRFFGLGAKVKVLVVNFGLGLGSDSDTVPQVQKVVTAVKRPAPIPKRLQRPGRRGRGGKLLPL